MTFWIVIGVIVLTMTAWCRWEARMARAQWGTHAEGHSTDDASRAAKRMIATTTGLGIGMDGGGGTGPSS